jgi:hypothetical protein
MCVNDLKKGVPMSMRSLESAITYEACRFFNNPKLRVKDLMEWSTGEIAAREGEVVARMALNGVHVAIKTECDKRVVAATDSASGASEG